MTSYDVSDDIQALVEDTSLPRRLKDEVYSTLEQRDVTDEQADEIITAVEHQYVDSRVDPLDPVGTVSAQSIGEPGTQMSVPADERIVVRRDGETAVTEIGSFVDELMKSRRTKTIDDHEVARAPDGLETLSLRDDERTQWKPIEEISRHEAPDELLRFTLESGREIRATKAHSFVIKQDGDIVPVRGDSLAVGDQLPAVGAFDNDTGRAAFDTFAPHTAADGSGMLIEQEAGQIADENVVWERIERIESVEPDHEYVYDLSVDGLETFTTAEGVITHNTMNTFHYAGVAEIDVTQGLPRLIELVDARKEPDTPMMTVHLEEEYAADREKAHEVVWQIEATKILALGDISTNVADMRVLIDLNEDTLLERWPTVDDPDVVAEEIAETIQSSLGVETLQQGTNVQFGPEEPSYRDLLQLVEELREITFKGIEDISRVIIRKEETESGEEFVLYTEGSDFGTVLSIDGVDASSTTNNDIH
jgi:DNA-directed RNA polymerase subunit A"